MKIKLNKKNKKLFFKVIVVNVRLKAIKKNNLNSIIFKFSEWKTRKIKLK